MAVTEAAAAVHKIHATNKLEHVQTPHTTVAANHDSQDPMHYHASEGVFYRQLYEEQEDDREYHGPTTHEEDKGGAVSFAREGIIVMGAELSSQRC
jgi:hypothetical protein